MCASLRWRPGPAACPAKKRGTAAGSAPLSWGRGGPIHVGRTGPLYSVFHLMAMCSAESGREHLSRSMPSIGRRRPPFTLSGMGAFGTSARAAGPPVFPAPQCQDDAARDAQHGQDQDHDIRRRHGTHLLFHSHAQYTAEIVFWQGEKMTHTIVEKCWKPVFQH